jgi:Tfp pilus assembly protein PilV
MMKKREKGSSLLETIVALALLSIISVSFLSALATTSTARATASERATSKILAESLMEEIKKEPYAATYPGVTVPNEYPGYAANITIQSELNGIQNITIAISHVDREVFRLESYKLDRWN